MLGDFMSWLWLLIDWLQGRIGNKLIVNWLKAGVAKFTECWLIDCKEVLERYLNVDWMIGRWYWKDNWKLIEWLQGDVGKITECWLDDCKEVLER